MAWQDVVITISQVIFIVSLFPSILSEEKPALTTCIMIAIGMMGIGTVYISLSLFLAASAAGVATLLWLVLVVQQMRRHARRA